MAKIKKKDPQQKNNNIAIHDVLKSAIKDPDVCKIYANSFINIASQNDVTIVLNMFDEPRAVVTLSLPMAQELGVQLLKAIGSIKEDSSACVSSQILDQGGNYDPESQQDANSGE